MYCDKRDFKEIKYILDNLNEATRKECLKLLGINFKKHIFEEISKQKEESSIIFKLKENDLPVAIIGYLEVSKNVAGIYFLSTKNFYNGALISFIKVVIKEVKKLKNKYKLLIDTFDKKNTKTRKLLELLGFSSANNKDSMFEVYYLGELDYLEEVENV